MVKLGQRCRCFAFEVRSHGLSRQSFLLLGPSPGQEFSKSVHSVPLGHEVDDTGEIGFWIEAIQLGYDVTSGTHGPDRVHRHRGV